MTTEQRYFHDWANPAYRADGQSEYEAMKTSFSVGNLADFPPDEAILYAEYTYEDYSGSAFVLFERDGVPYEVNGGHCSCYGLEDQWTPEETSWEALAMRPYLPDRVKEIVRAKLATSPERMANTETPTVLEVSPESPSTQNEVGECV